MSKKGETKEVLLEQYIRSLTTGTTISSQEVSKKINLTPICAGHYMRATGLLENISKPGKAGTWRRI